MPGPSSVAPAQSPPPPHCWPGRRKVSLSEASSPGWAAAGENSPPGRGSGPRLVAEQAGAAGAVGAAGARLSSQGWTCLGGATELGLAEAEEESALQEVAEEVAQLRMVRDGGDTAGQHRTHLRLVTV